MENQTYDTVSQDNEMEDSEQKDTRLADGDGLEIAAPEDFKVQRDDGGDLLPVKQKIPGTEKAVLVIPLHSGAVNEYEAVLEEDNAPDELVDEFLKTHIAQGPGQEGLSGLHDYIVPALIQAVKNSSGHDLFLAAQEQKAEEMAANLRLMREAGMDVDEALSGMVEEAE